MTFEWHRLEQVKQILLAAQHKRLQPLKHADSVEQTESQPRAIYVDFTSTRSDYLMFVNENLGPSDKYSMPYCTKRSSQNCYSQRVPMLAGYNCSPLHCYARIDFMNTLCNDSRAQKRRLLPRRANMKSPASAVSYTLSEDEKRLYNDTR